MRPSYISRIIPPSRAMAVLRQFITDIRSMTEVRFTTRVLREMGMAMRSSWRASPLPRSSASPRRAAPAVSRRYRPRMYTAPARVLTVTPRMAAAAEKRKMNRLASSREEKGWPSTRPVSRYRRRRYIVVP